MSYKSATLSGKIEEMKKAGLAPRLVSWENYGMIFGGRRGGGRRYAYFAGEHLKLMEERSRFLMLLKPKEYTRLFAFTKEETPSE